MFREYSSDELFSSELNGVPQGELLLLLLVDARGGRGRPLMMAGLKRRHRGRRHATRTALTNL